MTLLFVQKQVIKVFCPKRSTWALVFRLLCIIFIFLGKPVNDLKRFVCSRCGWLFEICCKLTEFAAVHLLLDYRETGRTQQRDIFPTLFLKQLVIVLEVKKRDNWDFWFLNLHIVNLPSSPLQKKKVMNDNFFYPS